jgi:hypothetical protein
VWKKPKQPLKVKLKGKEWEIFQSIKANTIDGTMILYNIKSRPAFIRWVEENTRDHWDISPMLDLTVGRGDRVESNFP